MFENKAKNWYGCYSRAGKTSAENFYAIIHKDDILKKNKKVKTSYEIQKHYLEYLDDKINFDKLLNTKLIVKTIPINSKKRNRYNYKTDKFKYKYHNLHLENLKQRHDIYIEPTCTKYNPNYDYIHKRLITGPKYKDLLGRKYPILNMEDKTFFLTKSYRINHDKINKSESNIKKKSKEKYSSSKKKKNNNKKFSIIDNGETKCLVNMDKTTQRGDFTNSNDVRIRIDKSFNKNEIKKIKSPLIINLIEKFNQNYNSERNKNMKKLRKNNYCLTNENEKTLNISSKNKNNLNEKINLKLSLNEKIKNVISDENLDSPLLRRLYKITPEVYEIPEISESMSREQKDDIKKFQKYLMPKINLNYSLTRERPLSMVVYKTSKHKDEKRKKFLGIDPSLNFDINKVINKYNNHTVYEAPNFDHMTSRSDNKTNPLPNFMQKIFNRMTVYSYNDKCLELNGYSDGKFSTVYNSFTPKNSFNSIINLSLLKKNNFDKEFDEIQTKNILKKIGFKNRNYEKLILDGDLDKFDKITFKTVEDKRNKFDKIFLRKFLLKGDKNMIEKILMNKKKDNKF